MSTCYSFSNALFPISYKVNFSQHIRYATDSNCVLDGYILRQSEHIDEHADDVISPMATASRGARRGRDSAFHRSSGAAASLTGGRHGRGFSPTIPSNRHSCGSQFLASVLSGAIISGKSRAFPLIL